MRWKLTGRTALITGAARGLGEGLARELADQGMNLVLVGLEPDRLQALAAECGDRALAISADVTDLAAMQAAVAQAVARFGGIDVVVANAGITAMAPLSEIEAERFRRVIEVNLMGVFNTLRAGAEAVFERRGYFLVVSSMAYAIQSPLQAHYCASKAAVTALANSFRLEARANGAEVGVIHPTFAATDLMTFTHKAPGGREIWNGNTGIWKMIEPRQVVDAMARAVRRRSRVSVVPARLWPLVLAPGLFQPILERSFTARRVLAMFEAYRRGRGAATDLSQPEANLSPSDTQETP